MSDKKKKDPVAAFIARQPLWDRDRLEELVRDLRTLDTPEERILERLAGEVAP